MNKFVLILFFILCSSTRALDSIAVTKPVKTNVSKFTEADIFVDNDTIQEKKFDKNFKKKYTDKDFIYFEQSKEKNAWERFKEWLADIINNIFNFSSEHTSTTIVSVLMKIIAISIIGYVVYLIVKAVLNKEGKWIFGKNSDKKIINYSDVEKNLLLVDFEGLIKKTLLSGERRLTIRYYYLWLLKKMTTNEIIVWDLEKTNSDYLHEIKNPEQKAEFDYLSYLYNYIWYGEFELDDETFFKAKNAFENALKSLRNV